jgi:large subunit ribosomal protein L22
MEARARARFVKISPTKARIVVDMVRGKRVEDALNILALSPKKASRIVIKLLESAVANATKDGAVDVDSLFIKSIFVDQGPTIKRFRARAMGRATRIRKRSSHLTVTLALS